MRCSRVELDLSDFDFDNKLTRFRDRVERFFSRVICRLRVDSRKDENRLSER
jgi:hypothetical protein